MSLIIPADAMPDDKVQPTELLPYNCTKCRHFNMVAEIKPAGYCLRYPPIPMLVGMQPPAVRGASPSPLVQAFFPQTGPLCVCGEFSPKDGDLQ